MINRLYQNKDLERQFFDKIAIERQCHLTPDEECNFIINKMHIGYSLYGMKVLEVGCATGEFGACMARREAIVYGVDISHQMIQLNKYLNRNVSGYSCGVGDIDDSELFTPNSFDIILCVNVLHHFPDCNVIIQNFNLWLRNNGSVYIYEPNGDNLVNKISKIARSIVKNLSPSMFSKYVLSSENENHDYTFLEYNGLFKKYDFFCFRYDSIMLYGSHDIRFNIGSIIYIIKCLLFWLAECTRKGNYIMFEMRKGELN